MEASSGGHNMPKIMTFRPSWEEFKDFNKYIEYIETQGAQKAGICKIIPPKEWVPRSTGYEDVDVTIPAPIQQVVHGRQGIYTQYNVQKKPIKIGDFKRLANSDTYKPPRHTDYDDLERKYWKNITFINPIYGADVSGSLTDPDQRSWNIQKLGSILDCLNSDYGISIEGVNTAYLYFGMWKTTFAWHTEDMDLYSINYIHYGAPKRWYAIPPEHGRRLERLAAGFFPESSEQCQAFLRHKMSLISPTMLKRYSIPYDTIVHEKGEIMITFPYGYHSGFNHGFNCAESTNFASKRWIEYGKRCVQCHCRKDSVKIDMGAFVKRFQPKMYELWKDGRDIGPHPEDDQSKLYNHHHNELVSSISPSKKSSHTRKRHCGNTTDTPVITLPSRSATNGVKSDPDTQAIKRSVKNECLPKEKKVKLGSSENGKQSNGTGGRVLLNSSSHHDSHNGNPGDSSSNDWADIPTDVSDALTDTEDDSANERPIKKEAEKSVSHAQTHTGTCKVKNSNKTKEDDGGLMRIDYPWAKSLTKLWRFNPSDFEAEKRYNLRMSQRLPYCAICSVINQIPENGVAVKAPRTRTPRSTVPLLPPACFMDMEHFDSEGASSNPPNKSRPLLICKTCHICVHDTCYGVKFLPDGPQNWQCSRCISDESHTAECALCSLRGGALKPTGNGRWAHIVCAIANTEVTFKSVSQREPVDISNISRPRATLKCAYCGIHTHTNGKDRFGKCVQCTLGQCNKAFHLTCARAAGVKIDVAKWPFRIYLTCTKHQDKQPKEEEEEVERPVMSVADEVYAKHKNGRYYKGEVVDITTQLYYCVLFDDNSTSKDLFPEDIINYKPRDGKPPLGSFVNVNWPDGLVYNGHFQGTREVQLYTVEFEDTSQTQVERDQLYSIHEQLPTQVQKRISVASEMKSDQFYRKDDELLVDSRTRGVQVNYNYKWDIIAHCK